MLVNSFHTNTLFDHHQNFYLIVIVLWPNLILPPPLLPLPLRLASHTLTELTTWHDWSMCCIIWIWILVSSRLTKEHRCPPSPLVRFGTSGQLFWLPLAKHIGQIVYTIGFCSPRSSPLWPMHVAGTCCRQCCRTNTPSLGSSCLDPPSMQAWKL